MPRGKVRDPEKKEEKPVEKKEVKPKAVEKKREEVQRNLVRVAGTDLDADKPVFAAIARIKGISHTMSMAVCKVSEVDPFQSLGKLGEKEITAIEAVIKDPASFGLPRWMLNRRSDPETGKDSHVSGADVKVTMQFDIKRMVDKKSYKGVRHMLGLTVRGQRTKSSFRKGGSVGVVRKSALQQRQPKPSGEKK